MPPARAPSRAPAAARALAALALAATIGAVATAPGEARAGAQRYEPMTDAVRAALAAAVLDRAPPEPRWVSVHEKVDWLAEMAWRLPSRHKPTHRERIEFLQMVRYESQRAGLDPQLVLGLIQVESGFRRHAISSAGARGYMQVMPFWTKVIGDGDPATLFDARTNLRFGCLILRHYIDMERGDLFRALGRYNGSLGRPEYPNAVLAAWRRWSYEPGPGVVRQVEASPASPSAASAVPVPASAVAPAGIASMPAVPAPSAATVPGPSAAAVPAPSAAAVHGPSAGVPRPLATALAPYVPPPAAGLPIAR